MILSSDREVAEHLKSILDSAEFQGPFSSRAWIWLLSHLKPLLERMAHLSPLALAGIVAGCLILLTAAVLQIWYAFRTGPSTRWRGSNSNRSPDDAQLSPESLAEHSLSLAAEGQFRDAARALQQSILLLLSRRHGLSWEPTLADWEWLRLLGGSPALADFTRRTQRVAFGAEANRSAFDECFGLYRHLVSDTE